MNYDNIRTLRIACMTVFFAVFLTPLFCHATENVIVELWTKKDTFLTHEPIFVYFEIKNEGDSTVYFNSVKTTEHLVITDTQGRGYATRLKGSNLGVDALSPGQDQKFFVDVCSRYGVQEVGVYSCHLQTRLLSVLNPTLLKSNAVKFKVVEPTGEDEKALSLFLEAEKLKWARSEAGGPDFSKKEPAFLKYQELVDRYPKSVYAPKALNAAVGVYFYSRNLEQRRRVIPVCIRLIEEYPDSYCFQLAFTELLHTYKMLKDKEGAKKAMQDLIDKHPNTNISQEAKRRLKMVEAWEFK
jgi:hypothetical protein